MKKFFTISLLFTLLITNCSAGFDTEKANAQTADQALDPYDTSEKFCIFAGLGAAAVGAFIFVNPVVVAAGVATGMSTIMNHAYREDKKAMQKKQVNNNEKNKFTQLYIIQ